MLNKRIHIQAISEFHDTFKRFSDFLKVGHFEKEAVKERGDCYLEYFNATEVWAKFDNLIEHEINPMVTEMKYLMDEYKNTEKCNG